MRNLLLIFIIGVLGVSCVPAKKLVYLQHEDELKHRKDIPKDTVLRSHPMDVQQYRIQPLDMLYIDFESITDEEYDFFSKVSPSNAGGGNNNQFLTSILVDLEGNIEYPVVGKINILNLTVFEAQEKIQEAAKKFLEDVVVRVKLLNFRFTVLGEVNAEQVVNSQNTRLTMMEAIGLAGGFSELADRSNVKIIRQVGGSSKVLYLNLLEEPLIESQYYFVHQNDVIIVSPLKQRTFKKYFTQNLGLITTSLSALLFVATILTR